MTESQFIHLRLHSEFSIVDGLVRIDDVVAAASKDRQPALALTDLSNLFGLIKFYRAARSAGIKPIAGCDVWVSNERERDKPSRLLLLVKNRAGYLHLCELLSHAWLENQHRGRAEISRGWLRDMRQKRGELGLIALSGAHAGDVGMALDAGNTAAAEALAREWAEIFPDSYYLEVQRAGQPGMESRVNQTVALAAKLKLPVVATHPIQFLTQEEFTAHEARICISGGEILADSSRTRQFNEKQCFKTQREMTELFADMPAALRNTVEIARRCNLTLELGKPKLPIFPTPEGISIDQFLGMESRAGLERRLQQLYPDGAERERQRARYEERLQFEIDTINRMGFAGYFLIVADFIRWAKENGVPVGPGRGSGAGSLVAYSLLITDLDPLAYNLLFERFLNPERVSMPDFDIDFCQEGRDRVIHYVKERYGKDAVSQIATFGTMAAKAAVRDVGRVLDLGYNFCDGISKLIPAKPGKHVTIDDARKEEPLLAEREANEEEVKQLLALAEQVEGITRNVGMHAGGVLIAPGKLTDFCPLYTQGGDAGVVSHYDKDDVEAVGLVKFDFLGLATLTILDRTVSYIRQLDPAMADFSLDKLPLDDRATYELLTKARTVAVFQLESRGMQGMLKDAKPDRFEDIIALVALYRPGPMDLIPDFCRRKHGERFEYPDPRTENILSETYGIMVYQEQVMQMAQVIGGYSLGGADLLRRAMGKKNAEEMAQQRQIFREGAARNGLTDDKADEIFDLMEKFAGYGFNKSHAAAYALLAYQTAYLKAHHAAAFMAANLSLSMDDTDKVRVLVEDANVVCGLKLLPPDINLSEYHFMPVGAPPSASGNPVKQIRYGLGAVRGTGEGAVEAIVAARQEKPFADLFDFCQRVDRRHLNRRTIDALIRSGAFDCFDTDRAVLLASVGLAIEAAEQAEASANQVSLFGNDDVVLPPVEYVKVPPWSEKERLTEEKAVLGFCLSGHLFDAYEAEARRFARTRLADLEQARETKWIAGIIADVRIAMTQRGKMLIVTLDDGSATVDVTVFSEVAEQNRNLFKPDEFLAVLGKVTLDRFTEGLRVSADDVLDIVGARLRFGRRVTFTLPPQADPAAFRSILAPYVSNEGLPLIARYCSPNDICEIDFGEKWRIAPSDDFKRAMAERLGIGDAAVEM